MQHLENICSVLCLHSQLGDGEQIQVCHSMCQCSRASQKVGITEAVTAVFSLGSLANGGNHDQEPCQSSKRLGSLPLCVLDYISPLLAVRSSNTLVQIKLTRTGKGMCPTLADKTDHLKTFDDGPQVF